MIGFFLKSTLAFAASYILMSFQINNAYLFEHITNVTGPVGENIQRALGESFERSWSKTKEMGGKMFTNSDPGKTVEKTIEDEVGKTQSALKKVPSAKEISKPVKSYLEELRKEERDGLSRIIESNQ